MCIPFRLTQGCVFYFDALPILLPKCIFQALANYWRSCTPDRNCSSVLRNNIFVCKGQIYMPFINFSAEASSILITANCFFALTEEHHWIEQLNWFAQKPCSLASIFDACLLFVALSVFRFPVPNRKFRRCVGTKGQLAINTIAIYSYYQLCNIPIWEIIIKSYFNTYVFRPQSHTPPKLWKIETNAITEILFIICLPSCIPCFIITFFLDFW